MTENVIVHLRAEESGTSSAIAARYFTLMVTTADIPARSGWGLPTSFSSSRIFTGTRHHLHPVAGGVLGGQQGEARAGAAPEEWTVPVNFLSGKLSMVTVACIPGRTRVSCVSLKFATTHTSCRGTMASSGCPS